MTYWGKVTNDIEKAMSDGTMFTSSELADYLGIKLNTASKSLRRMSQKNVEKQIYIARWVRTSDVSRAYLRAVYAWGNQPDAPKPRKLSHMVNVRAFRARQKKKVSSVWELR